MNEKRFAESAELALKIERKFLLHKSFESYIFSKYILELIYAQ